MLVLAVPVIGFSGLFSMLLGYTLPDGRWVGWISPLLGTVMYVWGGRPFLTGAVDEVRVNGRVLTASDAPNLWNPMRDISRIVGQRQQPPAL